MGTPILNCPEILRILKPVLPNRHRAPQPFQPPKPKDDDLARPAKTLRGILLKITGLSFFFSGALLLLAAAAIPGATSAATPTAGSTITLQNTNSKLCVGTGGSTAFTYLIQAACSNSKSQQFTLKAAPASGWYYLTSASSKNCWDVSGGSGSAGAQIQQYTCTAVWPEYFQLKAVSGGYELLSGNMASGCIDVVGASTSSGAHLEQNPCTGVANQIFTASVVGSGTGTSQPQVSLSPTTLSFGTLVLGTNSTQTVKLTNSGTASLTVSSDTLSGTGFSVSGLTFPLTVAAGQSVSFSVAFAPAASGSLSGSFSLISNATNSPTALALSGTGANATQLLTTNPTSLSFGSVNVGSTGSSHVTLTNSGNSSVTISSVTPPGAGFTTSGVSGGTTLSPNQSLTLNVAFAVALCP